MDGGANMRTIIARILFVSFTILWLLIISELLHNAYPTYVVIIFVILYGVFVAYALEVDERYDRDD